MTATDLHAFDLELTEPGVYDIPEDAYHRDPVPGGSLSASGAKKLLPPSCPALFHHELRNPEPPKRVFELGSAAHKVVLGSGPELVRIDADEWRTNAVKAEVAAARDRGAIPLKPAAYDAVHQMAAALRSHPVAAALFAEGQPEQTLIWRHEPTRVMCRARLDWLPSQHPSRRLIVPDYKTCECAEPGRLQRAFHSYGYAQQADWYLTGLRTLGLVEDAAFVFVAQEKTAPYLVTVCQLTDEFLQLGARRNRRALDLYAECTATGEWPGYSNEVELIDPPPYALREEY